MTLTSPQTKSNKRLTPFDFTKSINEKSENLMKVQPETEKDYNAYMVNRAMSFSPDAVLYANAMNQNWNLDKKLQYDYLFHAVRQRKRYDKWMKREEDELIPLIAQVYEVSSRRAAEYLSMLSKEDIEALRKGYGG